MIFFKRLIVITKKVVATGHSVKNQFNFKHKYHSDITSYNHRFFFDAFVYSDFLKLIFRLQLVFTAGSGFSNISGKDENFVFIIKYPRNRIIKNKKTLY